MKRKDSLAAKASRSSAADVVHGSSGDVPKAAAPLSDEQLQELMREQVNSERRC
jgi:hypothetical protein